MYKRRGLGEGHSLRVISGKAAEYKQFRIGNEKGLGGIGIFLTKKWVDKVTNISSVSDRMIVINILVQGNISVYATQLGLDDSQTDFYMIALSLLLERLGRRKLQLRQETLMVT